MKNNCIFSISKLNQFLMLLVIVFGLVLQTSCKKDEDSGMATTLIELIKNSDPVSQPQSGQSSNQLSQSSVETDCCDCTISQMQGGTSDPIFDMLVPDATFGLGAGMITTLQGFRDGTFPQVMVDNTGLCTVTAKTGSDTKSSFEVTRSPAHIGPEVTGLRNQLNPVSGTLGVDVEVYEASSAEEFRLKLGFENHSIFHDIAVDVTASYETHSKTYIATVVIKDFSVEVPHPGSVENLVNEWFPNLDTNDFDFEETPIYVGGVVYGKMLIMSIKTNLTKSEIEAKLHGSFDGLVSGGEYNLEAGYKSLNEVSELKIKTVGGSVNNVIDILDSSENAVASYLNSIATDDPFKTSAPLFLSFNSLQNGQRVGIVIASDEFIVQDCTPVEEEIEDCNVEFQTVAPGVGNQSNGFSTYNFKKSPCDRVTKIAVRAGSRIDQISFTILRENGSVDIITAGGGGGSSQTFNIPEGVSITKIEGKYGGRLYELRIDFSDGSSTGTISGGSSGQSFSWNFDEDFGGLFGRSGDEIDFFGAYRHVD